MLDLPLRGEEKQAGLPLEAPDERPAEPAEKPADQAPDEREQAEDRRRAVAPPPARPLDRRRERLRRKKKRRWPLLLILLLIAAAAVFAFYLLTTPTAGFSVETLEFGEQAVGGISPPLTVTVTNTGSRAMSLTGVRFTGEAAAEFRVVTDECSGSPRLAGETCNIEVAFEPAANGPRSASLDLVGNAIGGLPVAGTGAAPVVIADRAEIDFGPQPVDGRGASRTLNLSNQGAAATKIAGVSVVGEHATDFSLDDRCGSQSLAPDGSCAVRIKFTPRAAGDRAATVRVESDGASQALTVALSGAGVWSGRPVDATPEALDFGEQRRGRPSGSLRAAFINRTAEPLALAGARLASGDTAFAIETDGCRQATLAAGEECGVEVVFTPASEGPAKAKVAVNTVAGLETAVDLSGVGVEPRLELEKTALDFGDLRVGFQGRGRAVLSNSGTSKLAFGQATLSGADRSSFRRSKDGCSGFTLAPGRTCTIELVFEPRTKGRLRAELRIESDAANGSQSVELSGRGTAAELALDSQSLDFGSVRRPGSADRTLTLRNDGSSRLHVQRVSVTGAAAQDFVVSAIGCGESGLGPGASCQVTVRFVPRADGARAARLIVQHDGDGPAREVALVGTATPAVPGFRLSSRSIEFGTRQVGSRSSVETLTISNPGDGRLELQRISLEGAQAGEFALVPGTCDGAPFVAPQGSCTVGVRFTPRANGGRRATLRIRHNAGADATVLLNGQGSGG